MLVAVMRDKEERRGESCPHLSTVSIISPGYYIGSKREVPQAEKHRGKYFATPDLVKQYLLLVRCFISPIQLFSQQMDLHLSLAASAG